MIREVFPDLDTCVQEVLREGICLQSQNTLIEEPNAFVATPFEDVAIKTTQGQKAQHFEFMGYSVTDMLHRIEKKKKNCNYC